MGKTKFWVFQIMMVALVSLVLGNPVFADQPAVKGKPNFTEDGLPEHANQNAHDNVGGAGTSTSSSSEGGEDGSGDGGSNDDGSGDDGSTECSGTLVLGVCL